MLYYDEILKVAKRTQWSYQKQTTPASTKIYNIGLHKVDTYRGSVAPLLEALGIFYSAHCLPYAYAGVAYTLIPASYVEDTVYDLDGLQLAKIWLTKALDIADDLPQIKFIGAFIEIYSGRYDKAREILDALQSIAATEFHVQLAELEYQCYTKDNTNILAQSSKVIALTEDTPQKLAVYRRISLHYLREDNYEEALKIFQEMAKLAPQDPWLWHNMSTIYFEQKRFLQAVRHNKKALSIRDFPAARKVETGLRDELSFLYYLYRLGS